MRLSLPALPAHDYGRCPCGGSYEARVVEVSFDDLDVVLTDVPQAACPECGGLVYKAQVLEQIERVRSGRERPA